MIAMEPPFSRYRLASPMRGVLAVWNFPAMAWRCAVVTGLHGVHPHLDLVDGRLDRRAGASS